MEQRLPIKDYGSRIKAQGSKIKAQGSRLKDRGSRLKDQGSRIKGEDQGPNPAMNEHPSRAADVIFRQSKALIEFFKSS